MKERISILILAVSLIMPRNILANSATDTRYVNQRRLKWEENVKMHLGEDWQFYYSEDLLTLQRMLRSRKKIGSYFIYADITGSEDAKKAALSAYEVVQDFVGVPISDLQIEDVIFDGFVNNYTVIFQQYFKGVKIENARFFFSINSSGEVINITNRTFAYLEVNPEPLVSKKDAFEHLIATLKNDFFSNENPQVDLIILPPNYNAMPDFAAKLCYKIVFQERTFFVDAQSKEIVIDFSNWRE